MPASIKDVAKLAGVSQATVSNVRTGNKYVRPELVKRVNDAIEQLGYIPNPMASRLRGNRSFVVGVILPTFYHPFHAGILKGIQDVALGSEYLINVYATGSDLKREYDSLVRFLYSMPDGVILSSYANEQNDYGQECLDTIRELVSGKKKIPVISLERHLKIPGVESILSDYEQAAYDTVEYLIGLGHKKIAHISGPMARDVSIKRYQGYLRALKEHGIPFNPAYVREGLFTPESGYACTRDLMLKTDITAVFAANDETGIGAIKALKDLGRHIPQDVAVIGVDNIYAGTLIEPSLSTVDVPGYQMGRMAMSRMLEFTDDHQSPNYKKPTYLSTTIIPRKSTEAERETTWDLYDW
ncbi:LacI family DNA-binding transcriptional regulator [Christensenella timonensis]|uniref:LacI family DNA-binding transcriptional regulator n=1 Tax=Christensenella timonensis TaxID=1816678 RepID=UPI00082E26C5|nr:LacI family DNA-binding transcriptional regulator [Christensenella timonensis]